jgi:hypothetical protein
VFENVNFSQAVPHTKILEGVKNLTFIQCNLVNCDVPADAIIDGGNVAQVSRCSHVHSDWGLSECAENCEHVVDSDEIKIDGITIDKVYHYKDKLEAKK